MQHANAGAVISMQYCNGESCTILVSKSNNKYRLQGSSYEALQLPLKELLRRLYAYFAGVPTGGVALQAVLEVRKAPESKVKVTLDVSDPTEGQISSDIA